MPTSRYSASILWLGAVLLTALSCAPATDAGDPQAASSVKGTELAAMATDNLFAPVSYSIAAGEPYTLTMENAGDAIHNWHIIDVKGDRGKEIATPLTASHKSSSVTFAIAKTGIYHFQCDVHPDTMKGTITVRGS